MLSLADISGARSVWGSTSGAPPADPLTRLAAAAQAEANPDWVPPPDDPFGDKLLAGLLREFAGPDVGFDSRAGEQEPVLQRRPADVEAAAVRVAAEEVRRAERRYRTRLAELEAQSPDPADPQHHEALAAVEARRVADLHRAAAQLPLPYRPPQLDVVRGPDTDARLLEILRRADQQQNAQGRPARGEFRRSVEAETGPWSGRRITVSEWNGLLERAEREAQLRPPDEDVPSPESLAQQDHLDGLAQRLTRLHERLTGDDPQPVDDVLDLVGAELETFVREWPVYRSPAEMSDEIGKRLRELSGEEQKRVRAAMRDRAALVADILRRDRKLAEKRARRSAPEGPPSAEGKDGAAAAPDLDRRSITPIGPRGPLTESTPVAPRLAPGKPHCTTGPWTLASSLPCDGVARPGPDIGTCVLAPTGHGSLRTSSGCGAPPGPPPTGPFGEACTPLPGPIPGLVVGSLNSTGCVSGRAIDGSRARFASGSAVPDDVLTTPETVDVVAGPEPPQVSPDVGPSPVDPADEDDARRDREREEERAAKDARREAELAALVAERDAAVASGLQVFNDAVAAAERPAAGSPEPPGDVQPEPSPDPPPEGPAALEPARQASREPEAPELELVDDSEGLDQVGDAGGGTVLDVEPDVPAEGAEAPEPVGTVEVAPAVEAVPGLVSCAEWQDGMEGPCDPGAPPPPPATDEELRAQL